jgi:hypothetical protein
LKRILSMLAAVGATTVTMLALTATPAAAVTSSGSLPNFAYNCDGSAFVSSHTKAGRVEAWGGYAFCTHPLTAWTKVYLYRDGKLVATDQTGMATAYQAYSDVDVANPPGLQTWKAMVQVHAFLGDPRGTAKFIKTGEIRA